MNNNYTVYKHTSPSGKVYIGITQQRPENRWRGGLGYRRNPYFFRAILKYGWDNFVHEILHEGLSQAEACAAEVALIAAYRSADRDHGYNISTGGEGGTAGVPAWNKGRPSPQKGVSLSDGHKEKIREARTGRPHPHKGAVFTAEHRENLRQAHANQSRPVLCIETGEMFSSIRDAEKTLGVRHIGAVCNQTPKYRTAGGYHWAFYEE